MQTNQYKEVFYENMVMTIEQLKQVTSQPRESILRDLKNVGYYTSYNARGKFYTLAGIPEFDDHGLWHYGGAYFSARRTLLDTAEYLVSVSSAGYSHDELRRILGIEVQNSLYQLTSSGKIARRQVGSQYVYFGTGSISSQSEKRDAMPVPAMVRKPRAPIAQRYPDLDRALVIDILVAALRGHDTVPTAYSYLSRTGSRATERQVATVFRYYGIGKKNSPDQKQR